MSPAPDPNRRDFLNATVAVGGGLMLALTLPGHAGKASPARPKGKSQSQINAWLQIAADNSITLIVDRSEMGQGVYTALPMLMAEELSVDLDTIKLAAAPVGEAYISPGNGGQITGTSNSIQESWEKLRTAAAQARIMLIAAAAKRWRVDPSQCHASNGTIFHSSGRMLSYGEVADAASKEAVPKDVKLKAKAEFQDHRPIARALGFTGEGRRQR